MATISKIKTPDGNTYDITGSTIYATCDTAGATVAKVATLVTADVNTFALYTGCRVIVRFANANTAEKPTLQVGNTPAVQIMRYGTTAANKTSTGSGGIPAGAVQAFTYDGTYWVMDYWTDANSTYSNASLGNGYATCSTAEATTAKVGTLSSYALSTGGQVSVKFTYAVPASSTLNINSKGAKAIYFNGAAIPAGIIKAGDVATFVYSTQYHLVALNGSVVTAGAYGPSANAILSASGTFTVPEITVDATGRVTGAKNVTYTLPADNNTTYTSKAAASGGTEVSLVTTGEKYTWNNKSSLAIGTTSTTAAAGNHAHGNITNSGTITSTAVTTATGVLVYDSSNKIQRATAANVRSIIGAGTSDLTIGTTSTTAAAGNHTHSSYVNQNAFSNITVGSTTIAADSATDTFTLVAGDNVTLTPDATNDKITFTAKDTTYGVVSTTADGLAPKRDGSTTKFLRGDGTWATPTDTNTDTKVNVTLGTTTKAYLLGTSTTPTSTATAVTAISDTGVYLDTTAGKLTATTFAGALSGNASTATKFASSQSVALTGDVTGSASSQAGWSVATTLANSGVTAGSYGPSDNATPAHAGTFSVPYITVDAKGRVTAASTKTVTLPSDNNTDTKVNQAAAITTAGEYPVILAYSTSTSSVTNKVNKAAGFTYNPSTKILTVGATPAAGDNSTKVATTAFVQTAVADRAPMYTYGTTDLVAGQSDLPAGKLHFVYE